MWNETERRAYLWLHRRDDLAQGFRVSVFDPSNVQTDSTDFGDADRSVLVSYPDHFPGAPPIISGTYQVRWMAVVDRGGAPSTEEVAEDAFEAP